MGSSDILFITIYHKKGVHMNNHLINIVDLQQFK